MHLAFRKPGIEFLEESNMTGRDSFIVHIDQNFGRDF